MLLVIILVITLLLLISHKNKDDRITEGFVDPDNALESSTSNYVPYNQKPISETSSPPYVLPIYHFKLTNQSLSEIDKTKLLLWLFISLHGRQDQPMGISLNELESRLVVLKQFIESRLVSNIGSLIITQGKSVLQLDFKTSMVIKDLDFSVLQQTANRAKQAYWSKWVREGRTPRTKNVNVLPTSPDIDNKETTLDYVNQKLVIGSPKTEYFLAELDYYYHLNLKSPRQDQSTLPSTSKILYPTKKYTLGNWSSSNSSEYDTFQQLAIKKSNNTRLNSDLGRIEQNKLDWRMSDTASPLAQDSQPLHLTNSKYNPTLPDRSKLPVDWNRQRWWHETLSSNFLT
tara:strand:- start:224 stop:1255 length:1032 start_codon:yes stop_codon:yes gene_type:complete